MPILSIQSSVAYGHVGNSAAVFPLQRLGFEVWPVNTVQFSNHTGYLAWRGRVFGADHVSEVIAGIADRGAMPRCEAVLSGYVGDAATGGAILGAVEMVRAANPDALYCCDPVMGDVGRGVFVHADIPEFMRRQALPLADIATPNHFELDLLAGRETATLEDVVAAARALGPGIVMVTSVRRAEAPVGTIECLAVEAGSAWLVRTPLLPLDPPPNGAGDALAALFLGHLLSNGRDTAAALSAAVSGLYGVLTATMRSGSRELELVAAQGSLVEPATVFSPICIPS